MHLHFQSLLGKKINIGFGNLSTRIYSKWSIYSSFLNFDPTFEDIHSYLPHQLGKKALEAKVGSLDLLETMFYVSTARRVNFDTRLAEIIAADPQEDPFKTKR